MAWHSAGKQEEGKVERRSSSWLLNRVTLTDGFLGPVEKVGERVPVFLSREIPKEGGDGPLEEPSVSYSHGGRISSKAAEHKIGDIWSA
ncbi:unnamed protein product [Calypogeia fissa]